MLKDGWTGTVCFPGTEGTEEESRFRYVLYHLYSNYFMQFYFLLIFYSQILKSLSNYVENSDDQKTQEKVETTQNLEKVDSEPNQGGQDPENNMRNIARLRREVMGRSKSVQEDELARKKEVGITNERLYRKKRTPGGEGCVPWNEQKVSIKVCSLFFILLKRFHFYSFRDFREI